MTESERYEALRALSQRWRQGMWNVKYLDRATSDHRISFPGSCDAAGDYIRVLHLYRQVE